ncbi:MAG: Malonyl CoA-acyl carrier protein transacylase [Chlamydiia bacterium]|nr:Malonyl CoA-acyl carrier protein transacylase [Chlamydiia bacterium]
MKRAFVFPGQGAQKPFMGQSFYDKFLESKEVFQEAEDLLSMNVSSKVFSSDEDALKQTDFCQIALFVTSIAILRAIEKQFPDLMPYVCGGLSLGEYGALVASQKIEFQTLLPIVKKRGEFMQKASSKVPQGMCAVLGLEEKDIPKKYQVANLNSPGQVVIAGSLDEMQKAAIELKEKGARRVLPLKVSGAFHSSFMTEARNELKPYINECLIKDSETLLVMNVSGKIENDTTIIKQNLIEQVHKKTRWLDCMNTMNELDVHYIEIGPKQLSSLNKKMNTVNSFVTVENIEDLEMLYETV